MDAVTPKNDVSRGDSVRRPTQQEAEEAVRTLIAWAGDDPMRDEALAYAERLREAGIAVHSGVLPSSTGWPDSLTESPTEACPCAGEVREHVRAFFQASTPPPATPPPS